MRLHMRAFPWRRLGAATLVAVAGMAMTGIAGPGIASAGVAGTAPASQSLGTIKVSPGPLVLTIQPGTLPDESPRYQGEMPVQLQLLGGGSQGVPATVDITMPSGLWMEDVGSDVSGCVFNYSPGQATPQLGCILNGFLKPGRTRTIMLPFMAFAAPADHARQTTGGVFSVAPMGLVNGEPTTVAFGGVLAATDGSVANPVPYQQDTSYDVSATAGTATVTLGADGLYHGTVPVTFTYHTDAFNFGVIGQMTAPSGAVITGVEPSPTGPCYGGCWLTNSVMVSGQQTTVTILFDLPAGTRPGRYEGGVRVDTVGALTGDVTPSDNTATFFYVIR